MEEELLYDRVLWALARELYSKDEGGHWDDLTPAKKANYRVKADHALLGWGYKNDGGKLWSPSSNNLKDVRQSTHEAHDLYLRALVRKHPEEAPTAARQSHRKTGFMQAVHAVAMHAYEASAPPDRTWDKTNDHDKKAFVSIAEALLCARGFVHVDGYLQYSEGNGPIFANITGLLRDGFALNRVEALAHGDVVAFAKYGNPWADPVDMIPAGGTVVERIGGHSDGPDHATCPLAVSLVQDDGKKVEEAVEEHYAAVRETSQKVDVRTDTNREPNDRPSAPNDENPFLSSRERRVEKIAAESPYPVNEDGAESYAAVNAPAQAVTEAVNVLARKFYEDDVGAKVTSRHWDDLHEAHQKSYRVRAAGEPLDLVKLSKLYKAQWEADVASGRKSGNAPILREGPVEIRLKKGESLPDEKEAKAARVAIFGDEGRVGNNAYEEKANGKKVIKRLWSDDKNTNGAAEKLGVKTAAEVSPGMYDALAWFTYDEYAAQSRGMRPWAELSAEEQAPLVESLKACLQGDYPAPTALPELQRVMWHYATAVLTCWPKSSLRAIEEYYRRGERRAAVTSYNDALALAWFANETARADDPCITPWAKLTDTTRDALARAVIAYCRDDRRRLTGLVPAYRAALDIFLNAEGNLREKLKMVRTAYNDLNDVVPDKNVLSFILPGFQRGARLRGR